MNTRYDPIEQLREAFEAIEPAESAGTCWKSELDAAFVRRVERQQRQRALDLAAAREPVPWKLVILLAAAASLALALFIVPRGTAVPRVGDEAVALRPSEVLAEQLAGIARPVADADVPATHMMYLHLPTPPRELSDSWEQISTIFQSLTPMQDGQSAGT